MAGLRLSLAVVAVALFSGAHSFSFGGSKAPDVECTHFPSEEVAPADPRRTPFLTNPTAKQPKGSESTPMPPCNEEPLDAAKQSGGGGIMGAVGSLFGGGGKSSGTASRKKEGSNVGSGGEADCCQICPSNFYQDLSFLQLPAHVERAAIDRFRAWHAQVAPGAAAAPSRAAASRSLLSARLRSRGRGGFGPLGSLAASAASSVSKEGSSSSAAGGSERCAFHGTPKFAPNSVCCNICPAHNYQNRPLTDIVYPEPVAAGSGSAAGKGSAKEASAALPSQCLPEYQPQPDTKIEMPCCALCPKEFVADSKVKADEPSPPEADADGFTKSPALLALEEEVQRTTGRTVRVAHARPAGAGGAEAEADILLELPGMSGLVGSLGKKGKSGGAAAGGAGTCCVMCPADTYFASPSDAPFGEPMTEHEKANVRQSAYGTRLRDPKNLRMDYGLEKKAGLMG